MPKHGPFVREAILRIVLAASLGDMAASYWIIPLVGLDTGNPSRIVPAISDRASRRQPRNRRLTDVEASCHTALRFSSRNPLLHFALFMQGENRLTSKCYTYRLRIGAAPCCALDDAATFELRGNAKDGKDDLGKVGRGITEGKLAGEVLGLRRDAGVAVNHARIPHEKYASKKPNDFRSRV